MPSEAPRQFAPNTNREHRDRMLAHIDAIAAMPGRGTRVVSWSYTNGGCVSVCDAHSADVPQYTASGHSLSGVSRGSHLGYCDLCGESR